MSSRGIDYSKWDAFSSGMDEDNEGVQDIDMEDEEERQARLKQYEAEDIEFQKKLSRLSAQDMIDQDIDLDDLAAARAILRRQQEEERREERRRERLGLSPIEQDNDVPPSRIDEKTRTVADEIREAEDPSYTDASISSASIYTTMTVPSSLGSTPTPDSSSSTSSAPRERISLATLTHNGSDARDKGYLWSQTREEVMIQVLVPKTTRSKQLNVRIESGSLIVTIDGQPHFNERLAYRVRTEATYRQRGLGFEVEGEGEGVEGHDSQSGEGSSGVAFGLPSDSVRPSTQTLDIQANWTLEDMPKDEGEERCIKDGRSAGNSGRSGGEAEEGRTMEESSSNNCPDKEGQTRSLSSIYRRVEITLYKESPPGLILWWRRAFVGHPEIDLKNIEGRVQGGEAAGVNEWIERQWAKDHIQDDDRSNIQGKSEKDEKHEGNGSGITRTVRMGDDEKEEDHTGQINKADKPHVKRVDEALADLAKAAPLEERFVSGGGLVGAVTEGPGGLVQERREEGKHKMTFAEAWNEAHKQFREQLKKRQMMQIDLDDDGAGDSGDPSGDDGNRDNSNDDDQVKGKGGSGNGKDQGG